MEEGLARRMQGGSTSESLSDVLNMGRTKGDMHDRSILGSRIPLTSLVQALAVAEHLNFRHAANSLGVSQSSVSARMKALEEQLGILLFERHARGVRLTDAGRHFVDQVKIGISQLDHAVKIAGMAARGEHGLLRIGVYAFVARSFLADLLTEYRRKHSGIAIEMKEGSARDMLVDLREDRLDVAFVTGTLEPPDCHSRLLWTEPMLAALPANHPLAEYSAVTWVDLATETFLVGHGSTGPQVQNHIILRLAGHWPAPSVLRFDIGRGTLLSMVAQGFGITLVGVATSLSPTPGVVFLPVADEPEPIAFSAIWSPHNRSAALRKLLTLADRLSRTGQTSQFYTDSATSTRSSGLL